VQAEQQSSTEAVAALISELDLLGRITKRGKAVSLARRVAKRESKWYLANWRVEEDQAGLDRFFGVESNLNLKQLNKSVKRGLEIRALINEINREQQRILELKQSFGGKPSVVTPPADPKTRIPKKRKKRSFWNRLVS